MCMIVHFKNGLRKLMNSSQEENSTTLFVSVNEHIVIVYKG